MLESQRLAPHAQDDGFHEIQLNGKQLVFVFMAATVVTVVIFLCGVLVGRGVRTDRATAANAAETPVADELKPDLATPPRPPTVVQPGEDPTKAPPPPPPATDGESGNEVRRVEVAEEELKPAASQAPRIVAATPKSEEPAPKAVAREPAVKTAPAGDVLPAADSSRQGWVVQVAAVKTRGEADAMARRLSAKGYSAFVLSNNANVFRVRVGGYKSKRDAETMAAKLRKEERINPWVTR